MPTYRSLLRQIVESTHSYLNKSNPPPPDTLVYKLFGRIARHPAWVPLSADIFNGQIIAALIVITFIAIFLLCEWIAQDARPGVFDDNEIAAREVLQVPPGPQLPPLPPLPPAAPGVRPLVPRMDVSARLALALKQLEAVRAVEREERPLEERERELRALTHGRSAVEFAPVRSKTLEEELV